MFTGNKGEWSEAYVFLKLLAEGRLHAADKDLNQLADDYYPVVKIVRNGEGGSQRHYCLSPGFTVIKDEKGTELQRVPIADFLDRSMFLLNEIRQSSKSFAVPEIEIFLRRIDITALAAISVNKEDINVTVRDIRTSQNCELGFSIKSMLGRDSTLFNAGAATNFIFEVVGDRVGQLDLASLNAIKRPPKIARRIEALKREGCSLNFDSIQSSILQSNLQLIDGDLPKILASLLRLKYSSLDSPDLPQLLTLLKHENPLAFDLTQGHQMYEHKLKSFFTDSALGMMPSAVWSGRYSATGGIIIVKKDGSVLCYHIYNRSEFQDYLLENTRLEQASTRRYNFGSFYRENGKVFIKLNLQVRFR